MTRQYKFKGTVSSDGVKMTTTANEVIDFDFERNGHRYSVSLGSLTFETFASAVTITINDEEVRHHLSPNTQVVFEEFLMEKITILEPNVEYKYTGFYA